jgi:hypothetical protein
MIDDTSSLPVPIGAGGKPGAVAARPAPRRRHLARQAEAVRTRRAYRLDVQHFIRTLAITTPVELRQADHKAVTAWERYTRETEHAASMSG